MNVNRKSIVLKKNQRVSLERECILVLSWIGRIEMMSNKKNCVFQPLILIMRKERCSSVKQHLERVLKYEARN
jgi:hypothetical protein